MITWFRRKLGQDTPIVEPPQEQTRLKRGSMFSTHQTDNVFTGRASEMTARLRQVWNAYLNHAAPVPELVGTGDDDDGGWGDLKSAYHLAQPSMSDALFQWYGSQSFIGHQACAIIAQHWLVDKICRTPARDAIRQGYEIVNDIGEDELDNDVLAAYARYDKLFKIEKQLLEFASKGRIFGIRIAIPIIRSADPDYYEKPFNPLGVRPGSFRGWTQVDPYWTSPILDANAASRPDAPDFYEPTWWLINGKRYHRTHLAIFRTTEPVDLLKPSYLYSGIPIPQKIMERVYAAERTGNEAPLLALTKRLYTYKVDDVEALMANKEKFDESMAFATEARDNYGSRIIGKDDDVQQFDTSLADLAVVIEGQYKLACAAGDAPVNKIMGTSVGGLSSEGGYDQASYGETLESIQTHDLQPFLERHHLLVKLSYIVPKFGDLGKVNTAISWMPIDSPTALEYAQINKTNADADLALVQTGAISDADVNERLRNDKNSGYRTIRPIVEGEREPPEGDADEFSNDNPPETGTVKNDGAQAS
jgi:uncharacterized protein